MSCNCSHCNSNGNGKRPIATHPYGNQLILTFPMSIHWVNVTDGDVHTEDVPALENLASPPKVVLSRGKKEYTYVGEVWGGNFILIKDEGVLPIGTYDITVYLDWGSGGRGRYKQRTMLKVVDCTSDGGQYENDEFNIIATYPIVEGRSIAISIMDGQIRISENGKFLGDNQPNNGRADITAKQGDGYLIIEDGKAQLHI